MTVRFELESMDVDMSIDFPDPTETIRFLNGVYRDRPCRICGHGVRKVSLDLANQAPGRYDYSIDARRISVAVPDFQIGEPVLMVHCDNCGSVDQFVLRKIAAWLDRN